MVDMLLSSQDSVEFQLKQGQTLILKETYNPSGGSIRVSGLDRVIDTCLYGELKNSGGQDHLSGSFDFLVDDTSVLTASLYASHLLNIFDPSGAKRILSHGLCDVCHPGKAHPLTFIGSGTAKLYNTAGTQIGSSVSVGSSGSVYTSNCDPAALFPNNYADGAKIVYTCGTDTFTSYIDHHSYPDGTLFRFLNMYDAPETLLAKSAMTVKPQSTDDIGTTYGEDRKYNIEQGDEYTVESGSLHTRDAYAQWRDLVMSRRVEVLWNGLWFPVIITKPNYTQTLRKGSFGIVGFTFRMARQRDNGTITS